MLFLPPRQQRQQAYAENEKVSHRQRSTCHRKTDMTQTPKDSKDRVKKH